MLEALPENPSLGSNKAGEIIVNVIQYKMGTAGLNNALKSADG